MVRQAEYYKRPQPQVKSVCMFWTQYGAVCSLWWPTLHNQTQCYVLALMKYTVKDTCRTWVCICVMAVSCGMPEKHWLSRGRRMILTTRWGNKHQVTTRELSLLLTATIWVELVGRERLMPHWGIVVRGQQHEAHVTIKLDHRHFFPALLIQNMEALEKKHGRIAAVQRVFVCTCVHTHIQWPHL